MVLPSAKELNKILNNNNNNVTLNAFVGFSAFGGLN